MGDNKGIPGEQIYEYVLKITRVAEYGFPAEALLSGRMPPPPEGARFDVYFDGVISGKMNGAVQGVDYVHIRADGRSQLDIHAEITTNDGKKIALAAGGVGMLERGTPIVHLRENVALITHHAEHAWLNTTQVWAMGTADFGKGEIRVKGYAS